MTSAIRYPLVPFYDADCRSSVGIVLLEAAYRAAWDGEVSP
ncbi:MAG TPA: hypothetical protein VNP36_08660 [Burkholderiales bacterium]|nr:hypothetical protein [Burkholderiales bacterium]